MKRNCFYTSRIENCDKVGLSLSETISNDKPDESSSRGVNGSKTDNIKVEDTSSSSLNTSRNDTSRNDSIRSESQKVCETEQQLAELLQKSLRNKQLKRRRTTSEKNKKKNISEIAVRKSGRDRKAPDRLQVDSTKGKSYVAKSST